VNSFKCIDILFKKNGTLTADLGVDFLTTLI